MSESLITIEHITEMKNKLSARTGKWAPRLAKKMKCSTQTIYNLTNNILVNNDYRIKFLQKGKELLDEIEIEERNALSAVA